MNSILEQIAEEFRPSKMYHNYMKHYSKHLSDKRDEITRVLEIGLQKPRSLLMWEKYFTNADIIGIDINPACLDFAGGRKVVLIGDQSDEKFLESVGATYGPFDLIIDDGSHIPSHQLRSFRCLMPYLTKHGTYVIEGIGPSTNGQHLDVVRILLELTNGIYWWPADADPLFWDYMKTLKDAPELYRRITGIACYRWIVFMEFGDNPGENPYLSEPDGLTDEEILRRYVTYAPDVDPQEGLRKIREYFSDAK